MHQTEKYLTVVCAAYNREKGIWKMYGADEDHTSGQCKNGQGTGVLWMQELKEHHN